MLNVEQFREYCLQKKGVTEEFPFDESTLVFKVMGKMFALTGLDAESFSMNLKCDPDEALALREKYPAVVPGYHMSKTHWNTVYIDGSIPDKKILQMIDTSYDLVLSSLPKKIRESMRNL